MGMHEIPFRELPREDQDLVRRAAEALGQAYAPYSRYAVGAAVRTRSGAIHTGANLENASYGLTLCAEVIALGAANTAGDFQVTAIAVVARPMDPPDDALPRAYATPCGRCRQVILEAAHVSRTDVRVLAADPDLERVLVTTIAELLPRPFGPRDVAQ
jgi:cytidine deaminase